MTKQATSVPEGHRENAQAQQTDCRRAKYLKEKCLEAYGIKQPLRWLEGQKVSEIPDFETWHVLLKKTTEPMVQMPWADVLHNYGSVPSEASLTGWHGVGHLLATLVNPAKAEIFEAKQGEHPSYYIVPRSCPETLFLLRHDGYFERIAVGNPLLQAKDLRPLLEATMLRVWGTEGAPLRWEVRNLLCDAFSRAVLEQCTAWQAEYDQATVACTVFQDQCHWGPGVLRTDKVVVWQIVQGKYVAELFPGDKFTPDSFNEETVQRIPMMNHSADSLLYGVERRFLFKRRSLEFLLREFNRDTRTLCVVPVYCDTEVPVERILFVARSSLKHPNPTDGEPLLCPGV